MLSADGRRFPRRRRLPARHERVSMSAHGTRWKAPFRRIRPFLGENSAALVHSLFERARKQDPPNPLTAAIAPYEVPRSACVAGAPAADQGGPPRDCPGARPSKDLFCLDITSPIQRRRAHRRPIDCRVGTVLIGRIGAEPKRAHTLMNAARRYVRHVGIGWVAA
jgi:hypothetical protein